MIELDFSNYDSTPDTGTATAVARAEAALSVISTRLSIDELETLARAVARPDIKEAAVAYLTYLRI